MKKIIVLLVFTGFITVAYSQTYFQKVTTGDIVSTVTSSDRCAWGDYDNDGFQDLVITGYSDNCTSCSYPILQYHNNGDGTFSRILSGPIATFNGRTFGCAWGDYDNDGKLDLFVSVGFNQKNILFHNDGNGAFTQITTGTIVNDIGWSQSCNWCDYDKDGWLDLFVTNEYNYSNFLYHNNGNGTFTRVTNGSIATDIGWSRGSAWGDYDNDGWPDLFVVNYQSGQSDFLYHNNGNGTFTRILSGIEVNDNDWGSACAWGDYDNDGYLDLYVTNNNSSNKLYHNNGNSTFNLSPTLPSVENGLSFGCGWSDFDNDGYLDLFVAKMQSNNALFKNIDGQTFSKVTNDIVGSEGYLSAFGLWGDYNNDGKIDLFVSNSGSPTTNYLYKNISNTGNYLICKLIGCHSNKAAIGAKIKIYSGNLFAMREISGGSSMGTQDMLWQHFGLGSHSVVDSIVVSWPFGNNSITQKLMNIASNQTVTINECPIGIINNEIPVKYELKQNYPNPFNPVTQIEYSLVKPSNVKIKIFDLSGKEMETLINEHESQGTYRVTFDGTNYASGAYFYKIETDGFTEIKKMILIK